MNNPIEGLRGLSGDALIAFGEMLGRLGEAVRGGFENVDVWPSEYVTGAMECDGPALAWSSPAPPPIGQAEVRAALDELSDSELLRICANIIAGWKPLLLLTTAPAATDVDLLVETLNDRADQFRVVERENAELDGDLTNSGQSRPQ